MQVPDELEDEDMMEMLNAGVIENIVVDDWKAKIWAQILPNIKVNEGAVVREGGKVGWAMRKDSPKLQAEILAFYKDYLKKQGVAEYRMKQAMSRVKQMKNNATDAEYKKFVATLELFQKYGAEVRLRSDHARGAGLPGVAAQPERQEPRRRDRRHADHAGDRRGAEGRRHHADRAEHPRRREVHGQADDPVLQGREVQRVEPRAVRVRELQRGPGNVSKMRKEAEKRGLDPDKWFNNVELVTAEKIGIETTTYVRNIYKYYVSYRLTYDRSRPPSRRARRSPARRRSSTPRRRPSA